MFSWCGHMDSIACKPKQSGSDVARVPCLPAQAVRTRSSWGLHQCSKSRSSGGVPVLHLSAASTPLLSTWIKVAYHAQSLPHYPKGADLIYLLKHQRMFHTVTDILL